MFKQTCWFVRKLWKTYADGQGPDTTEGRLSIWDYKHPQK